ncbi:hypothetical protein AB0I84_13190 [Streptomyces spectabilis]|uniref:hypothetical protein n=1 Tax=Streptomyces spectabilis TaxID=68270 RepID=UPI0033E963F1
MTDRIRLDDLTDDALDALYARAGQAEAAIERARALAAQWARTGQDPNACIDMDAAAEALLAALDEPGPITDGGRVICTCTFGTPCGCGTSAHYRPPLDEQPGPVATRATDTEKTARVFAALHRCAEQDITRVIALYEQWVAAGPPPLGTSVARWWGARFAELHDAMLLPTHHTTEQPCTAESSPQKSPAPSPPDGTPTP